MSKKDAILMAFVAVLGGVYICFFTDWFKPKSIWIEHTARPLREAWTGTGRRVDPSGKQADNISFSLHKDYKLTSVMVFRVGDLQTNKNPHALWHLVAKNGSTPVNTLSYGMPVEGMTPYVSGLAAEPLVRGIDYRLVVKAGSLEGTNDFTLAIQRSGMSAER